MKKPVTQFLPLVLSSLAFAGVFSSWVLGCQSGTPNDLAGPWPATVNQHGQSHQPRDFLQKNDAWLRGQEAWFSDADAASPNQSLYIWLQNQALVVCDLYEKLRTAEPPVLVDDPGNFCRREGMDPTNPPQPCEWGECPEPDQP